MRGSRTRSWASGWRRVLCWLTALGAAFGCAEAEQPGSAEFSLASIDLAEGLPESCRDLLAGRTTVVGQVCAEVAGETLTVRCEVIPGWELLETHLWVGEDPWAMPLTASREPMVGRFPYGSDDLGGVGEHVIVIPLADIGRTSNTCVWKLLMAAHAVVAGSVDDGLPPSETAWGEGVVLDRSGSWAMLMIFGADTCGSGPVVPPSGVPPYVPVRDEPSDLPGLPDGDGADDLPGLPDGAPDDGADDLPGLPGGGGDDDLEEPPVDEPVGVSGLFEPPVGDITLPPERTGTLEVGVDEPVDAPRDWVRMGGSELPEGASGVPGATGDGLATSVAEDDLPHSDGYAVTGCGCSVPGRSTASWLPLALLVGLALVRRRR